MDNEELRREFEAVLAEQEKAGLITIEGDEVRLTDKGWQLAYINELSSGPLGTAAKAAAELEAGVPERMVHFASWVTAAKMEAAFRDKQYMRDEEEE